MRKLTVLLAVVLILGASGIAMAVGPTATQTVTYEVQPINELTTSGNPAALTINAAVAGLAPTAVSDASSTYAVTTNMTGSKISGKLTTAMPSGVTLTANLVAPTGGTSAGAVALTDADQDLVTVITKLNESKGITYGLSATSAAGKVISTTNTVTFTITSGT